MTTDEAACARDLLRSAFDTAPLEAAGVTAPFNKERADPAKVLNALAQPLFTVEGQGMVIDANVAAETFFAMGRGALLRSRLADLLPFGSPVVALVADAMSNHATVAGYKIDISTPTDWKPGACRCFHRAIAATPATPSQLCCRNGQLPKK